MLANGCVESKDFDEFLIQKMEFNPDRLSDEHIGKIIEKCNRFLTRYNMMIRTTMDDILKKKYHILISTVDNEITHAAHYHTPKQFEFFKLILTSIVANPRGIITLVDLENLGNICGLQTKGKTKRVIPEHRAIYNEWCMRNWFINVTEANTEYITLGVRSMAELDVFIKQDLVANPQDLDCKNCNHISIYSVLCRVCQARFHKRCAKMSIDPDTGKCKVCN